MKILYCGDLVGRAGRSVVNKHIKEIREKYNVDVVLVNGENAAHGFGLSSSIAQDLLDNGVDGIFLGNHVWEHRDIYPFLDTCKKIIRPLNLPANLPGKGAQLLEVNGKKILIVVPIPRKFFVSTNQSSPRQADTGEKIGEYTIYNATGFLGALERDCL